MDEGADGVVGAGDGITDGGADAVLVNLLLVLGSKVPFVGSVHIVGVEMRRNLDTHMTYFPSVLRITSGAHNP